MNNETDETWDNPIFSPVVEDAPSERMDFAPMHAANRSATSSSAIQPSTRKKRKKDKEKKGIVGTLIALIVGALKWGALILSKVKFLGVFLSMIVSIAAYSLLWGWTFALGFVLLLLVHEYGHIFQLKREGVASTAPLFIPFLGAVVGMKEMSKDSAAEARVGLAGPVAGTLASCVPLAIYLVGHHLFWRELAYVGFFLNLFNLIPVLPLDGGRAMSALSPKIWFFGLALATAMAVFETLTISFSSSIILYIIIFVGGLEMRKRFRQRKTDYYSVPLRVRALIALTYFALLLGTGIGTVTLYLHQGF
jgi:Zn-dependent protease